MFRSPAPRSSSRTEPRPNKKEEGTRLLIISIERRVPSFYARLSVGDEDRDGGENNAIQNQKKFLESYARQLNLTDIRHYIDDESGRFFCPFRLLLHDRGHGKRQNRRVHYKRHDPLGARLSPDREHYEDFQTEQRALYHGIDTEKPDTLRFAPFINIMSEWYAKKY